MNLEEFTISLKEEAPPAGLSPELEALWYEAKGDWYKAHQTVMYNDTKNAAWVHAYLHRKEGNMTNAKAHYKTARKAIPKITLDNEFDIITETLLKKTSACNIDSDGEEF